MHVARRDLALAAALGAEGVGDDERRVDEEEGLALGLRLDPPDGLADTDRPAGVEDASVGGQRDEPGLVCRLSAGALGPGQIDAEEEHAETIRFRVVASEELSFDAEAVRWLEPGRVILRFGRPIAFALVHLEIRAQELMIEWRRVGGHGIFSAP